MNHFPVGAVLAALVLVSRPASADVDDDKPWDWATYESLTLLNSAHNSACDATVQELLSSKLTCSFEKKSWDAHLAKELKVERIRDRNRVQPSSCMYSGLQFFRPSSSNGGYPTSDPVLQEFREKVASIECRFDDVDKAPWVSYVGSKKQLVLHFTRREALSGGWIARELRKPEMKTTFPALNKFWSAHS